MFTSWIQAVSGLAAAPAEDDLVGLTAVNTASLPAEVVSMETLSSRSENHDNACCDKVSSFRVQTMKHLFKDFSQSMHVKPSISSFAHVVLVCWYLLKLLLLLPKVMSISFSQPSATQTKLVCETNFRRGCSTECTDNLDDLLIRKWSSKSLPARRTSSFTDTGLKNNEAYLET